MSGTIDFNAIATALATQFASVTAPAGETALRFATEVLPSQVPATPCILITPPDSVPFNYRASARTGTVVYHAKFLLERVRSTGRNATLIYKWLSALYAQIDATHVHLGLPAYVNWAEVTDSHIGVLTYAGENYEGIDLEVTVHLGEGTSPTA